MVCDTCEAYTANPEDEYGEHICDNCAQNAAERAWERHCEDFHDGGASGWRTLAERQADARRLK
jgi:hypothetical protein